MADITELPLPLREVTGKPDQWLAAHDDEKFSWFEEAYRFLRAEIGMRRNYCFYAAWLSVSKDDRGDLATHADLANFLGVNRSTLYTWRSKHKLDEWAEILRVMRMRGDRMAEVDQAAYDAAVSDEGKSTDRRLFYERAGVLGNQLELEERRQQDRSLQLLNQLKAAGNFDER